MIRISKIFPIEYNGMVEKQKNTIQNLINTYDVVIFMARKAICFYKALLANGEIVYNNECLVLSSRVITFNVLKILENKSVAIVDDVVVRGKSIKFVNDILKDAGIDADIYVMAWEKGSKDVDALVNHMIDVPQYMDEVCIDQLSNLITKYIYLSGIPYNIDQPIYKIRFSNKNDCEDFLHGNRCINISDGAQKKHGIENYSIHFRYDTVGDGKLLKIPYENILLKIRLTYNKENADIQAVPFVLLPELAVSDVDYMFSKLVGEKYDILIFNKNNSFQIENKLKVIQYILAECFMEVFVEHQNLECVKKDICNEKIIFTETINTIKIIKKEFLRFNFHKYNTIDFFYNYSSMENSFSMFYDLIFDPSTKNDKVYFDGYGNEIKDAVFTLYSIENVLHAFDISVDKYTISCILDVMIDKGVLIPSIVHTQDGGIIRGYKNGEIFKLQRYGINLFHYMLFQYYEVIERNIGRTEFEKLCVLFFKKTAYSERLFDPVNNFEDDCYSIAYSKFGPMLSNCEKKYSVNYKSALVDQMITDARVHELGEGKVYSVNQTSAPTNSRWEGIANDFAYDYYQLYTAFRKLNNENEDKTYINRYRDLLTLLAIGPEKRNQFISLIAELNLFVRIDLNQELDEIINSMHSYYCNNEVYPNIKKYIGIMDGIDSGLWKYCCYINENLMDDFFIKIRKIDPNVRHIKSNYLKWISSEDVNQEYDVLLNKCGRLLFEIAYTYEEIYNKVKEKDSEEFEHCEKLQHLNMGENVFEGLKEKIKDRYIEFTTDQALRDFQIMKKEAEFLIDECDLCLDKETVPRQSVFKNLYVVYDPEHQLQTKQKQIIVKANSKISKIHDCFIINASKNEDIDIFNNIYIKYLKENKSVAFFHCLFENEYDGITINGLKARGRNFVTLIDTVIEKLNLINNGRYVSEYQYFTICDAEGNNRIENVSWLKKLSSEEVSGEYFVSTFYILDEFEEDKRMEEKNMYINNFTGSNQKFNFQQGDNNQVLQVNKFHNITWNDISKSIDNIDASVLKKKNEEAEQLMNEIKKLNEDVVNNDGKKDIISKIKDLCKMLGKGIITEVLPDLLIKVAEGEIKIPWLN